MCAQMSQSTLEVRGQLAEASSLLPPYGSWGLNSGHWAWHQAPSSAESAHQHSTYANNRVGKLS